MPRHVSLGHETLLCTFRPLPLPCQVKILHLEGFKTCAKHVPPGPQTLPCSFSPLPALCHRRLPLPCQVAILHLEGFKTCAKHVPPGPYDPPCSFSPSPDSTWQSARKGLKLHGGFWGPGGTCFAQLLKPSLNAVLRPGKARAKGDGKAMARG